MATQSKGQCTFCKKVYSKGGLSKHLASCKARSDEKGTTKFFHLQIESEYDPIYWLHVEIPAMSDLEVLDKFLRDTWLECCGHLSAFNINGQTYTQIFDDEWFAEDKDMTAKLNKIFSPGLKFTYEYDFGSTTHLKLKVVGTRTGKKVKEPVKILAQNNPPEILCHSCGKPATEVCTMCIWEGTGWVCEDCAEKHECGVGYFLPVVNSPRVGVCGYIG